MSHEDVPDPFDVLEIPDTASEAEAKAAYRRLANLHHPDRQTGSVAGFERVRRAYETVMDHSARKVAADARRKRAEAAPTRDMSGFDAFFDGIARNGRGRDIRATVPVRGEDRRHDVFLGLAEAFSGGRFTAEGLPGPCQACAGLCKVDAPGGTKCPACGGAGRSRRGSGIMTFEIQCPGCGGAGSVARRACDACGGTGQEEGTGAPFAVEPGVEDGTGIRLQRLGHPGKDGGIPGDLLLTVRLKRHPVFERRGRDLAMRLRVSVWDAAMGCTQDLRGIDGELRRLAIPPGTDGGARFRIPLAGMPSDQGPGDLHVTLGVSVPDASAGEMRSAFERVRALAEAGEADSRRAGAGSAR